MSDGTRMHDRSADRLTRVLFLIGSVAALVGSGTQLVARFAEARWLLVPAIVLWIVGGIVVLVAAGRYVSGRSPTTDPAGESRAPDRPLATPDGDATSRRDVVERARELSLLLDRWDFLGVYDPPEEGPDPGEYDDLVWPIMRWLSEGARSAELSRRLHERLIRDYELSPGEAALETDLTTSLVVWWTRGREAP